MSAVRGTDAEDPVGCLVHDRDPAVAGHRQDAVSETPDEVAIETLRVDAGGLLGKLPGCPRPGFGCSLGARRPAVEGWRGDTTGSVSTPASASGGSIVSA